MESSFMILTIPDQNVALNFVSGIFIAWARKGRGKIENKRPTTLCESALIVTSNSDVNNRQTLTSSEMWETDDSVQYGVSSSHRSVNNNSFNPSAT